MAQIVYGGKSYKLDNAILLPDYVEEAIAAGGGWVQFMDEDNHIVRVRVSAHTPVAFVWDYSEAMKEVGLFQSRGLKAWDPFTTGRVTFGGHEILEDDFLEDD